jgi:hypothetical protein
VAQPPKRPRYLRIVKLRDLLVHDRGWSDEVIDELVDATRNPPPDTIGGGRLP